MTFWSVSWSVQFIFLMFVCQLFKRNKFVLPNIFFLHKQGLWWLVVDRLNNPVSFIYSGALEQWVMDFLLLWDLFFTWTKCRSVSQSWPYVVIHVSFNWREKVQTYFVETENVFNWDFNWNHWLCSFYSVILLIN